MNRKGKGVKDFNDIIGNIFGQYTVLEYLYSEQKNKLKDHYYKCVCVCGETRVLKRRYIQKSFSVSCGCNRSIRFKERLKEKIENGGYYSQVNHLYYHARNNAKYRGYTFNIDKKDYNKLILSNCHYCGSTPYNTCKAKGLHEQLNYNGLDRVNNDIGYEINNVVPCCKICNLGKHTLSYIEFKEYLKRVAKFIADSEEI